jgi:CheY-like chemotaxis protein
MSSVLVVADERAIREFLEEVLTGEGYQFSTASDGQAALTRLAAAPPDLVLLDIMMPVLDGREVLRRMRADPTLSRVAVLVMSAAADPGLLWVSTGACPSCSTWTACSQQSRSSLAPLAEDSHIPYPWDAERRSTGRSGRPEPQPVVSARRSCRRR